METTAPAVRPIHLNRRLGLWYGARLGSLPSWAIALLLMLGSVRGLIVIHSDLAPGRVYLASALALLLLAGCGYFLTLWRREPDLRVLKNLLAWNLFLGLVNIAIDLFLGVPFEPSALLYMFITPYVVFLFLRVPSYYLHVAVIVITLVTSYSVAENFFETLRGPAGIENVMAFNQRLRPDVFYGLSRTGAVFRAAGYTGSYHDSANILGMVVSLFFVRFLLRRRSGDLLLALAAMLGLTLTQSAANILIAIFTCGVFALYSMRAARLQSTLLAGAIAAAGVYLLFAMFGDFMSVFLGRIDRDADWGNMTYGLSPRALWSMLPYVALGHATAFGAEGTRVELAALKTIYQLGVVHALLLFWILLHPALRFARIRRRCPDALPAAAATVFGALSLMHYGSLFRVTSIFLFFALYAICLKQILACEYASQQEIPIGRARLRDTQHPATGLTPALPDAGHATAD